MTKVAALEYVGQGVRVNTLVPGGVKTPIQANVTPEQVEWYKAQIPMGDLGEPNDIAYGALYLLSDEAKYVTGTELFIDGGWRSEEHTSELQSLMRRSYAVFCLKKKTQTEY